MELQMEATVGEEEILDAVAKCLVDGTKFVMSSAPVFYNGLMWHVTVTVSRYKRAKTSGRAGVRVWAGVAACLEVGGSVLDAQDVGTAGLPCSFVLTVGSMFDKQDINRACLRALAPSSRGFVLARVEEGDDAKERLKKCLVGGKLTAEVTLPQ
jgi:hypothetical protein